MTFTSMRPDPACLLSQLLPALMVGLPCSQPLCQVNKCFVAGLNKVLLPLIWYLIFAWIVMSSHDGLDRCPHTADAAVPCCVLVQFIAVNCSKQTIQPSWLYIWGHNGNCFGVVVVLHSSGAQLQNNDHDRWKICFICWNTARQPIAACEACHRPAFYTWHGMLATCLTWCAVATTRCHSA